MKRPERQRRKPHRRRVADLPTDDSRLALAKLATYGGSVKHKDIPSFAGEVPRPRIDASICPRKLTRDKKRVEGWLREAIRVGNVGSWDGAFPSPVWHREQDVVYEAHLTRPLVGEYHGFPLESYERVEGLRESAED